MNGSKGTASDLANDFVLGAVDPELRNLRVFGVRGLSQGCRGLRSMV